MEAGEIGVLYARPFPFPKVTHILYKHFKRLKHKEETEIILIFSLERTTVNILFFFGCTGSLLLHMSYSLVAVHKLLMAVAPLVGSTGAGLQGMQAPAVVVL